MWKPALGAMVERTIRIVSPCPADKPNYCNGNCFAKPCDVVNNIKTSTTATTKPPQLLLLGPGSTKVSDGSPNNRTMYLGYRQVMQRLAFHLQPCWSGLMCAHLPCAHAEHGPSMVLL